MKEYMETVSVTDAIKASHTDTLCWDCQKALNGGCSWSNPEQQKPVNGWTAKETSTGFCVSECPEFVRGTYGSGMYRTADDYIIALENRLMTMTTQMQNLKKTLWWKHVNKLRCQNRELQVRIKRLAEIIKEMKKEAGKDGEQG